MIAPTPEIRARRPRVAIATSLLLLLLVAGVAIGAFAATRRPASVQPAQAAGVQPAKAAPPAPVRDAAMVKVGGMGNACACSQRIEP